MGYKIRNKDQSINQKEMKLRDRKRETERDVWGFQEELEGESGVGLTKMHCMHELSFQPIIFKKKKKTTDCYLMDFWRKIKLGTLYCFYFIPKFYFLSLSPGKVPLTCMTIHF